MDTGNSGPASSVTRGVGADVAVDRAAGGKDDVAHAAEAHGLDNIEGADGAILKVVLGVVVAVDDIGVGGKVPDEFVARHHGLESVEVENVGFDEGDVGTL